LTPGRVFALTWISHTICWHWGGESEKVIFGQ
jgi:hypothetical protein